ncbi:MAG: glycosyltransferase family 2 protein [Synergistaceae bacterium]|nr:glycosyltransferase family 2 protein [Synergistaceae bacterium]
MQPIIYIVAPAYNESENITQFVEEWYPVIERHDGGGLSRLVVIDDGSKDNTYSILQDLSRTRNLLLPLTKKNSGHGPTCIYGYQYAIEHGADLIFQTDTDGQTSAEEFEAFWAEREDYDAILGKRPDRKDGASRKFVEHVLRLILRIIFGVKIPDANAPFRLMRSELVKKYIAMMPEDFNLPNVMLTTYFVYFHENIAFKNISFQSRRAGKNFINIRKIINIGIKAVKGFYQLRKNLQEASQ